jgi:hypothetical protein
LIKEIGLFENLLKESPSIGYMFIAFFLLIATYTNYEDRNAYRDRLVKACESYSSLISTLRSKETQLEYNQRMANDLSVPNSNTPEGRFKLATISDVVGIYKACNGVSEVDTSFPTYYEILNYYLRQ